MKPLPPILQLYILMVAIVVVLVMFYGGAAPSWVLYGIAAVALGYVLYRTGRT